MLIKSKVRKSLLACTMALATAAPGIGQACTSLLYTDANGLPYSGRTLELSMELPYNLAFFPAGTNFGSKADQHHVFDFTGKNAFFSVGMANPTNGHNLAIKV